jgi:hypothetical protein
MARARVNREYAEDGRPGKSFQRVGPGQAIRRLAFLSHSLHFDGARIPSGENIAADGLQTRHIKGIYCMTPTHPRHEAICSSCARPLARCRADYARSDSICPVDPEEPLVAPVSVEDDEELVSELEVLPSVLELPW